ncbi:putative galactosylceramide sulfotransferase-like [Apostichopus japonicus]|uniref:Putative galactosylceramide sulfotransferase-like n=1 Tax=Stichopus japonicus TaxID=307972 RepID=A0A2G8LFB5_STIJA|nr:putative galactosylceramide sulfotransferase-like [Apostichopus japonicus]
MDYRLSMTNDPEALQKFLQNAQSIYDSTSNKVHMKNPMLFDMGVAIEDFNSEALVKKHIKTFHKRYRLVMVAEYFEESLILLRDLLCWTTEDVVVFKLNTRKDDSIVSLTEKAKQNIRDWNNGDVLLYEHFNRTIQKTIDDYGRSRMAQRSPHSERKLRNCTRSASKQTKLIRRKAISRSGSRLAYTSMLSFSRRNRTGTRTARA